MGGQTTTTQNSSQQSQTQPWAAAQPQLLGLLGNLGNVGTGVTPQQSAATGALTNAAAAGAMGFGADASVGVIEGCRSGGFLSKLWPSCWRERAKLCRSACQHDD